MRTLTLRGLAAHKRRLFSTMLAVLLGVAFMAGSLIFTDTMRASLSGVYQDAERNTDTLVRGPATIETGYGVQHAPVDGSLIDDVEAVPGVAGAAARIEGFAQVLDKNGESIDDLAWGATPMGAAWSDNERLNPFQLVDGRGPQAADEVVVDRSIADNAKLSIGDTTSVLTGEAPTPMEVVGIATFAGEDNRAGNRTVLFTPEAADKLLAREGSVDAIAVEAADGVSQSELAKALNAALPAEIDTITGEALIDENANRKNEDVQFFSIFMTVFAVVALLVGAFIISNTFTILVAQRTRELALLRAIGASARQIRRSVALEALVVGLVASALGLVAGAGVAIGIERLWDVMGITMPDGPLVMAPRSLLIAFVVGVLVTFVSALLPARRAARIAPVAAMRQVAVERTRVSRRRVVIGLVLTALSAAAVVLGIVGGQVVPVLVGAFGAFFGVATLSPLLARPVVRTTGALLPRFAGMRGLLARENAMRNPRRTAATASALMIGVAMVGSITAFATSAKWSIGDSFDREFRGDLAVETGAWIHGGVSPDLSRDLAARPEVGAVAGHALTLAEIGDDSTELSAWPGATVGELFDLGVTEGSVETLGGDGLAIGTKYAEDKGLALGDKVPVTFDNGAKRSFTVKALFEHTDWTWNIWVDRSAFTELLPDVVDTTVYVKAADGVDTATIRATVDDAAAGYANADVRDRDEMKAAVESGFDTVLSVVYALLALAIVIALLGIANTVALSVVERTQELGLLRAVGMSRGHMRGMVRWEAALIAVFGTLTGLAVGLFLGWAMVFAVSQEVETAKFVVPYGQLAIIVAIAAACGVLAALLPARRAARLDVLQAIATT